VNPNAEKEVADNFTYYARNSASGEVATALLEEDSTWTCVTNWRN